MKQMRINFLTTLLLIFSIGLNAQRQQIETITIKGENYIVRLDDSGFSVVNSKGNRILSLPLKDSEGIKTFEFKDFNKDGYEDIFLEWSNLFVNDLRSLYLFIPSSGKFRKIKDFFIPAPTPLKGTKLFYSYYQAGCANYDWKSGLFSIENYRTVEIGIIEGNGCEIQNSRIDIYKIKANQKVLLESLALDTIENHQDNKFEFIKEYWTKNYRKFK
ncbi:hypothetical protein [Leptospira weilii]|nr:hypothetical protein [Leptospira weilii]